MKTRRRVAATAALALTLLSPAGALAGESPVTTPIRATVDMQTATGLLEYEPSLETPHYTVGGVAIQYPSREALDRLVGKQVSVKGRPFDGVSVLLKPQLVVTELRVTLEGELVRGEAGFELDGWALKGAEPTLAGMEGRHVRLTGTVLPEGRGALQVDEVAPLAETLSVSGVLEYESELESPHFVVDGWALKTENPDQLRSLVGKRVTVTGHRFEGISILMRRQLVVTSVSAETEVRLPVLVGVAGKLPYFPEQPYLEDGHLMLPLRAVVEAAGGAVAWNGERKAVEVKLLKHTSLVHVGQKHLSDKVTLPAAPVLKNGHTMVPLEALAAMGLVHRWERGALLIDLPGAGAGASPSITFGEPAPGTGGAGPIALPSPPVTRP